VIFADADIEAAVAGAFHAIYNHGGQCCTAGTRLFGEEHIHDEFVAHLADQAKRRRVGDPLDLTTQQGPQVSQEQLSHRGFLALDERASESLGDFLRAAVIPHALFSGIAQVI
jgi:acyl-CoA reductase-like NAD-dependent aldehyde dehydrogenase